MSDYTEQHSNIPWDVPQKATKAVTLEQEIMDPSLSKTEAEWWAYNEITKLRSEISDLNKKLLAAAYDYHLASGGDHLDYIVGDDCE